MSADKDLAPHEAPKLGKPTLELSTKIGLVVLALVLVFCVASIWLPSPAGLIAAMLFLYVGLSLALLVVSDFGKLRQDRLVVSHASLQEPTPDDPDRRVMLDVKALARDHLAPWRAWRRWIGVLAIAAIAIAFLPIGNGAVILPGILLVLAWLRDLQLAIRLLDTLPKSAWLELSRLEQAWLRIEAALLGLILLSIWLGVVAIVAYLFSGHVPVRWNTFAFAAVYGTFGLAAMLAGRRWMALAYNKQPGLDAEVVEVARFPGDTE